MVEAGEGGELRLGDRGRILGGDQSIGVRGVTDDKNLRCYERFRAIRTCMAYLDRLLGNGVEGVSLDLEDLGVGLEKILALHAFLAGHGTNLPPRISTVVGVLSRAYKQSDVAVLEGNGGVGSGNDLFGAMSERVGQAARRHVPLRRGTEQSWSSMTRPPRDSMHWGMSSRKRLIGCVRKFVTNHSTR